MYPLDVDRLSLTDIARHWAECPTASPPLERVRERLLQDFWRNLFIPSTRVPFTRRYALEIFDNFTGPSQPGTLQSWSVMLFGPGFPAVCNALDCGADPVPTEVPPTMTVVVEGGTDLRFDWSAVTGAAGYRVWRSDGPAFGQEELVGTSSTTTLVHGGGLNGATSSFFLVRAVNSCEWEGP